MSLLGEVGNEKVAAHFQGIISRFLRGCDVLLTSMKLSVVEFALAE